MVIAAEQLRSVARLVDRRAAELAAPDDERRVEQPALLQVRQQRADRLIDLAGRAAARRTTMSVPMPSAVRVPAAVIELDEAHAALDEPAREQAVVGERHLARLGAVHLVDLPRLVRDVGQLRDARLHPVRQLVRRDARRRLRIAASLVLQRVRGREQVQRLAPRMADPRRPGCARRAPARPSSGTRRPGAPSAGSRCPSSSCRRPGCSAPRSARRTPAGPCCRCPGRS